MDDITQWFYHMLRLLTGLLSVNSEQGSFLFGSVLTVTPLDYQVCGPSHVNQSLANWLLNSWNVRDIVALLRCAVFTSLPLLKSSEPIINLHFSVPSRDRGDIAELLDSRDGNVASSSLIFSNLNHSFGGQSLVLLRTSPFAREYRKHAPERDLKALENDHWNLYLGWSDRRDPYEHYVWYRDAHCRRLGRGTFWVVDFGVSIPCKFNATSYAAGRPRWILLKHASRFLQACEQAGTVRELTYSTQPQSCPPCQARGEPLAKTQTSRLYIKQ